MPAREFLSKFFPVHSGVPSAFREGIFDGVLGPREPKMMTETDMYEPFVSARRCILCPEVKCGKFSVQSLEASFVT